MVNEIDGDWTAWLASYLGASGPALRLLISVLMSYPFAMFHRMFLYKKSPLLQHLYFIMAGSYMGYFNYGSQLMHAYICIVVQYLVIYVNKGKLFSVIFSFLFQMGYLLGEYYVMETAVYDIKWTIPHCVLTLRLIGQAFDIFDGTKNPDELSKDQKEQALKTIPSIFACAAHVFYPGSFMIGPQFPLRRYFDFVEGKFSKDDNPPPSIAPGLQRLVIGLTYIGIYQLGSLIVNNEYIESPSYQALPLYQRLLIVGLYGRVMLYKYVSCWIVSEGACILAGISYNGRNSKGEILWDGCENVQIAVFEKSYKFGHLIASFNKCTNHWIAQNVYKRLRFVGNRYVSQGAALLFLAVWHGLHSGYYVCFMMEFIVMKMEKDLERMMSKNPTIQRWHMNPVAFWIDVVICKIVVTVFFGYCTLPFGLLKFERWWGVYKDLYFIGCIIFGLWPLYAPLVKLILTPSGQGRSESKSRQTGVADKGSDRGAGGDNIEVAKPNGLKAD